MIRRTFHNNEFLLIPGTDQPQIDEETGLPKPDPLYGQVIEETVESPAVPPVQSLSALAFKRRFTAAERIAIRTLAKTDPIVADFMDLLDTAGAVVGEVHLADPDLIAGVGYFENVAHIISAGRAAEILTP
jgi:hypothetical protein